MEWLALIGIILAIGYAVNSGGKKSSNSRSNHQAQSNLNGGRKITNTPPPKLNDFRV